jgi:ketosteroid isomerase-like protein
VESHETSDFFRDKNYIIVTKRLKTFLLIGSCLSFSYLFSQQNIDTAKANKEVLATLKDYVAALKQLDISKTVSYYSKTKDFLVYDNGKAWNYEEFVGGLKTSFSQIKEALVSYDSIYVRSIAENAVLTTGPFHQTLTSSDDRDFHFDGTASFVWLKRDGQWKLTYATVVSQLVSN